MSSKLSYRSVVLGINSNLNPNASEWVPLNMHPHTPPKHTYYDVPEVPEEEFIIDKDYKYENHNYSYYQHFIKLRESSIFQKKFQVFAENILCVTNTDVKNGLRMTLPNWASLPWKGHKKSFVWLYLTYKQDGFTYDIAYECDNIEDPSTGWFMQWFHNKDCCGYSCDYYGCHNNYIRPKPKKAMKI